MKPICQICGHEITGKAYYWDDDPRLSTHPKMTQCKADNVSQAFCDFMNRNVEYLNRRGEPILIGPN